MKLIRKSLKNQFLATAIAISIFLVSLGFFTNLALRRTNENYHLSLQLEKLSLIEASLARIERDFLLIESVNPEFFKTGNSRFILEMDSLFNENQLLLGYLAQNRTINRLDLDITVDQLISRYQAVETKFDALVVALREYGFEDYGLSGVMRKHIHDVETVLDAENQYELTSIMLTLRRHEKDFMLRKDPKYIQRFDATIEKFVDRLTTYGVGNEMVASVLSYQGSFRSLAEKDMEIGTASNGILNDIKELYSEIDPMIEQLNSRIKSFSKRSVNRYRMVLLVAFILVPTLIIAIYSRLSNRMVKRLVNLRNYMVKLGDDQLPDKLKKLSNDEIGEIVDSLNRLIENLRNTREFALEVGKGNFNTGISVFGNKGDLGGSLIQMKNQLEEAAKHQEIQKIEEKQRTWNAEGTALFARLLRSTNTDTSEMAYTIISNLVKYLELNQGGLFLLEGEGTKDASFRLAGCYAYDRRKFVNQVIPEGEGLIGACSREKQPIYITDLPQNYISITSGLGETSPDCLFLIPLLHDEKVYGVIELAGFEQMPGYKREFATKVAENVAAQISVMKIGIRTADLLRKSEEMAESLKQQEEVLKQNMEEMMASQEESEKLIQSLKRELADKGKMSN